MRRLYGRGCKEGVGRCKCKEGLWEGCRCKEGVWRRV